jgi:hypothetical protein
MGLNNNLGKLAEVLTVSGSSNEVVSINSNTAITGSLIVTQGITGSLFGTASYATTASYLEGYISPFPYTGSALITGSLEVTGSVSSTGGFTGSLFGTASFANVAGLGGFVQGGNSFGSQALIGTNDNQSLALETSGSIRMFVSSSGNVGIGETTPGKKLDVIGHIRAKYAANSSNISFQPDFAQVYLVASSADNTFGDKKMIINSSGLSLRAMGSSTAAMEITSDGKVGIGTISPNTLLEVASTTSNAARIRVNNTNTTAGQYRGYEFANGSTFKGGFLQDQNTDLISIFTPIGGQSLNITSGGNVGIGTTNITSATNQVVTEIYAPSYSTLRLSAAGTVRGEFTANNQSNWLFCGTTTNHPITFGTNDTERVRITSGGNVEIGKNYSNAKLDITGNTLVTGSLLMVSTGSNSNVLDVQGTSGPLFNITDSLSGDIFSVSDISGLPILNINSNGNVDIDGEVRIAGRNLLIAHGGTYETRIQANSQINSYFNSGGTGLYLNFQGNGPVYAGSSYAVLYAGSDRRIKTDIEDVEPTLDKILNLTPRTFKYKERPEYTSYGFIAQEVEEVMPEIVKTEQGVSHCNGEEVINQKSVESYGLAWASILVKGMQEQQELINTLTAKIDLLEQKLK